jgi:hypothetical protein
VDRHLGDHAFTAEPDQHYLEVRLRRTFDPAGAVLGAGEVVQETILRVVDHAVVGAWSVRAVEGRGSQPPLREVTAIVDNNGVRNAVADPLALR